MHPSISIQAFQERRTQQLRVDHVTKRYAHGTLALDEVSLTLTSGLTCVVGPTGAGKSTLLNVLSARERPDQGEVRFGDIDAIGSPALLRTLAAHVPTDTRVPPPVPVHVALEHFAAFHEPSAPQLRMARVEAQLRRVDLWGARTLRVGELTPAMHWRMMLAIALLGSPRLLLLDVPSHELDDAEFLSLLNLAEEAAQQRFVILATSKAHLIRDRCVQIVFADEQPGAGFVAIEPDLTHVYQYDLAATA